MKDRNVQNASRFRLTKVPGTDDVYDLIPAPGEVYEEGTLINKSALLKDATAAMFGLDENAVPDDAFVSLTNCFAQILVTTSPNTEVTASLNGKTVKATSDSSGLAILKIMGFGTWTISATVNGVFISTDYEIKVIAQYEITLTTNLETVGWDVIDSVSKSGNAASIWSVGDKKTIVINGTNYQVQIIGFNHDDKTAGGKAGITFQMVDCLSGTYNMNSSNTNNGGWKNSAMRSRMSEFLGQLGKDLQSVIKPVNKLTSIGSTSTIETVSDKLFLLSEVEIFGSTSQSFAGEGSQYDWYKAGNTKVKKVNGSAHYWWERSPRRIGTNDFCAVSIDGYADSYRAGNETGVSFGFCV